MAVRIIFLAKIDDIPNPLLSEDYTINVQKKRLMFFTIGEQEPKDAVGRLKIEKRLVPITSQIPF